MNMAYGYSLNLIQHKSLSWTVFHVPSLFPQGAKLFYLSGMVYGEYQTQEVKNLGRFISVMKFRPLVWQQSHPYVVADRWVSRPF